MGYTDGIAVSVIVPGAAVLRWVLLTVCLCTAGLAASSPSRAQSPPEPPAQQAGCADLTTGPLQVNSAILETWTACERWVWSCIADGKEANMFARVCASPRRDNDEPNHRGAYGFAPFHQPDAYRASNAIGDGFLRQILTDPQLLGQIPAAGVRIYGAYFEKAVNLENATTERNLVLDAAIFKRGIRMTNFETTKNVSFDGANVRGKMLLMRARIGGSLFMERGVYDFVDLRDARIGASLEASRSVFTDMLRFDRASISGKVYLVKSRLTSLNAWDATIGGSMELRLADIRMRMDLTGTTVSGDVRLQEVTSGVRSEGGKPSCQWDPDLEIDHILHEAYAAAKNRDEAFAETVLDEMMRLRPTIAGKPADTLCDETTVAGSRTSRHEFLLRDMKVNGTLCVMDTTGAITNATASVAANPASAQFLDTVSLDGTVANSTVLRWTDPGSDTLWHAVNFKTRHMLINLEAQPQRHFIDNLDVEFISFVRRDRNRKPDLRDEDDDKYLCDVTPHETNVDNVDAADTQRRIVSFFTGPSNLSGSAQPFANVLSRLDASGVETRDLNIELSEYKYRNACQTSQIMRDWKELHWLTIKDQLALMTPDEVRKLFLDGICATSIFGYKWLVSYGHEPLNLFVWVVIFVAIFWVLLQLDRKETSLWLTHSKYSLAYAIDNFHPLKPYRIDPMGSERKPNSRWLRGYLVIHRMIGVIFVVLFFVFVYRASV